MMMIMTCLVKVVVAVGMLVVVAMGMGMLMAVGNTVVSVLMGMGMVMIVGMSAHVVVMNMHKRSPFNNIPFCHCEESLLGSPQKRMAFVGRGETKTQVKFFACKNVTLWLVF